MYPGTALSVFQTGGRELELDLEVRSSTVSDFHVLPCRGRLYPKKENRESGRKVYLSSALPSGCALFNVLSLPSPLVFRPVQYKYKVCGRRK